MQENRKNQKLWSKYFILFCVIGLVISIVVYLLDNVLSIYSDRVWGSEGGGGFLTTTFTFGSIVATALSGTVIDRTGRKKALIFGFGVFTLGLLGMVFFTEPWIVYLLRVLQGIGKGVGGVAITSAVADVVPKNRMGEGMGYYGLGSTLAMAVGPTLGLLLISDNNFSFAFLICTAGYLLCTLAGFFVNYEKDPLYTLPAEPEENAAPADARYHGLWKLFEKAALPATFVVFMYGAGCTPILIYITLYATKVLQVPQASAGIYLIVGAVAMLITRFTVGKLIDRRGVLGVLILGNAIGILSNIALLFVTSTVFYYACGALYGFATALIYPALQAAVIVDSPDDRRGAANALMLFGLDFGILLASAFFGYLQNTFGSWTLTFTLGGAFYAAGLILTVLLMSNAARARRREKMGITL